MVRSGLLSLKDMVVIGPRQVNPHIHSALAKATAYSKKNQIYLPHHAEYSTMSAYIYPKASESKLVAINLLMDMSFYVDDLINDDTMATEDLKHRKIFSDAIKVFRTGATPPYHHPLLATCKDLHKLFFREASEAYMERFITSAAKYLKATTLSLASIVGENGQLTPDQYIYYREHTSGMRMTVNLVEFVWGIDLPQDVREHPVFKRMYKIASEYGCLMNDIFSYYKEVTVGGTDFNLICVYMQQDGLNFEEGVHAAVSYLSRLASEFVELERAVPTYQDAKLNEDIAKYVEGIRDLILACWHWQWTTNRYRSPNSPFPELQTSV